MASKAAKTSKASKSTKKPAKAPRNKWPDVAPEWVEHGTKYQAWLHSLKAGDRVGIDCAGSEPFMPSMAGRVKNVGKYLLRIGRDDDSQEYPMYFHRTPPRTSELMSFPIGRQLGGGLGFKLEPLTPKFRKKMRRDQLIARYHRLLGPAWNHMTEEQLEAIVSVLEEAVHQPRSDVA